MLEKSKSKGKFKLKELIEKEFKNMSPKNQAKWSLSLAKHVLERINVNYKEVPELVEGFNKNEKWQTNNCSEEDVRIAAHTVQTLATKHNDHTLRTAIRMAGHAIASGDRSDHALVASDYAIKVIALVTNNDYDETNKELNWQLKEIKRFT